MADRRPARPGQSARPQEGLRCRVRLADGRVFCGELPAWRHRALQLGMLHAQSEGLVELTPGTRPPGGKVEDQPADRRPPLPARRRRRHGRPVARAAARARRADRLRRVRVRAVRRRAARGGVRRRRAAHRAARQQGRGRAHALPVAGRRQARPAPGAVGLPGRAAVSAAVRVGGVRWRALLLEADRAAARRAPRRAHRRGGRADRAGEPAADPRARLRPRRHPERRRPPVRRPRRGDAPLIRRASDRHPRFGCSFVCGRVRNGTSRPAMSGERGQGGCAEVCARAVRIGARWRAG